MKKKKKKKKKVTAIPGVIRYEYKRCSGWYARITRNKVTHAKLFGDVKFGGSAKAFLSAKKWRDDKEKKLGPGGRDARAPGYWYLRKSTYHYVDRRGRWQSYEGWTAVFYEDWGVRKCCKWACSTNGPRKAKRLAQEWVKTKERELNRRVKLRELARELRVELEIGSRTGRQ